MRFTNSLLLLSILFLTYSCSQGEENIEDLDPEDVSIQVDEVPKRYGIEEDAYKIHEGTIKKNQFLADILLGYGVPYGEIAELEGASKDVHDVRKLKAGDNYAVFTNRDSTKKASFFVVETSPANYVVYQLGDSISAYLGQKPIETKLREAGGMINSSLYQTIADNDLPIDLAMELSLIYAWTVDFYRIQKGDYFKVIFEERFVEGQRIGVGEVIAAEFGHRDEIFSAFLFEEGKVSDYFDLEGENLRRAFLKAPVKFSRISSRYTMKRYHPVQRRFKAHLGTDYAAPQGTPIVATADGEVIASAYGKYNGNYVKIRHNSTYTTQYLHMSKRAVNNGAYVRQGDVIGYVGSTGLASGPHVCYRFWVNGKQVDPYQQDLPSGDPIPEEFKADFSTTGDSLNLILEQIEIGEVS
ncbi:peptidoglycan DD-metalloendopeptidase family protein [Cryomorphaceae bacterium 1068]|nr:peptidoglycan DD-metalloendopeptidase family protein [Cryomorphaceae bacterium 1068]